MRTTKRKMLEGVENVIKSKIIANNTLEIDFQNGIKAIRLHNTNIITFQKNGNIILNSGGWRTLTTKDRLNQYTPFTIFSVKGIWYISKNGYEKKGAVVFYDRITFDKNLELKGKIKKVNLKKIEKEKKKIKNFVNLIDKMEKIPIPSGGDCWDCNFKEVETGRPLGDISNSDHLKNHIKEGYIHGSLIFNALKESGYVKPEYIMQLNAKDSIKRALYKYLKKRLIKFN